MAPQLLCPLPQGLWDSDPSPLHLGWEVHTNSWAQNPREPRDLNLYPDEHLFLHLKAYRPVNTFFQKRP